MVHSTIGMAPWHVTDPDILAVWKMEANRRIRVAKVRFSVRQHVRIGKEKMKFAKGGEQNISPEIFRITKVIEMSTIRRAGGFKQDTVRGTILRGGTDSGSNLETDHLQDR